jgi:hypothetical protein
VRRYGCVISHVSVQASQFPGKRVSGKRLDGADRWETMADKKKGKMDLMNRREREHTFWGRMNEDTDDAKGKEKKEEEGEREDKKI